MHETLAVFGTRVDEQVDEGRHLAVDDDRHLQVLHVLVALHQVVAAGLQLREQHLCGVFLI